MAVEKPSDASAFYKDACKLESWAQTPSPPPRSAVHHERQVSVVSEPKPLLRARSRNGRSLRLDNATRLKCLGAPGLRVAQNLDIHLVRACRLTVTAPATEAVALPGSAEQFRP